MDFISLTFYKGRFPRFDNASEKYKQLLNRYSNLLHERRDVQEKKCATVILCKRTGHDKFPAEINDLISGSSNFSSVHEERRFNSSNIDIFLKSVEESIGSACVFIVNSNDKNEFMRLRQNKNHIILLAKNEDEKKEVEGNCRGKIHIAVSTKEKLTSDIDDILERITLAPLKPICEHCYEMFKQKISINATETTVHKIDFERKESTIRKITKQAIQRNGHPPDKLSELNQLKCKIRETHRISPSCTNDKTTNCSNGSTIFATTCTRAKTKVDITSGTNSREAIQKDSTSTSISTQPHIIPGIKMNGFSHSDGLNSCSESEEATRSTFRNSNTRQSRKRSIELSETISKKDKKRKVQDLEQTKSKGNQTQEENPEYLLEAILAVYGMSNVPELERPKVPIHSKKIDEQMKDDLFKICPTIKRMGYRYRTFYIYAVKPVRLEDEAIRDNKIRSVLRKYDIFPYEISACNEKIERMMHTGAKIEARFEPRYSLRSQTKNTQLVKGGTLGCFVKAAGGNKKYCLLSKHVTEHCSKVYYVENGNNKILGPMIPRTNGRFHGGLDISAATMNEPVNEEAIKFKDRQGQKLKGFLHDYNEEEEDGICRSGQSVHINGAVSKPGVGEITMPIVHDYGLRSPLIQVEDITTNPGGAGNFANEGDSGAVMCVEDPEKRHVIALGMVMGRIDHNSSGRKYLALPLSKGVQQIEAQTRTRLELM
ncbi:uncharacterized protein LOC132747916 [Ruditapes philippinarum]|uniref:uncharacterized protein LOC132747916 n=1 Tax=Ruditapes philippinarum TaxID=129788 RepID=UPI00295AFF54|nr:uncharacterized protein LOC132747916 [Ruditapes philippinarum]